MKNNWKNTESVVIEELQKIVVEKDLDVGLLTMAMPTRLAAMSRADISSSPNMPARVMVS